MDIAWYRRKPQPDVRAVQWDGEEHTLQAMQDAAGKWCSMIVSWKDFDPHLGDDYNGLRVSILTPGADHHVRRGDWVLFTDDGLYVSRKGVFEKWYDRVDHLVPS